MYLKPILLIVFIFLQTALLEDTDSSESGVVPTSTRFSTIHKKLEDRISKVERQLKEKDNHEVKTKLNEVNQQLQTLTQEIVEVRKILKSSGDVRPKTKFPKHCKEVQEKGHNVTGVYTIQPEMAPEPFLVLCDMDTNGGGWTYVVNRFDGSQDFFLDWDDYKNGFGNLAGEFWLGLQHLHYLTGYELNELLIELEDWDSKKADAHYSFFSVGSEPEGYPLKLLGEYKGTAGDSLRYHAGMKFTTTDRDHDRYNGGNCGTYRKGGWWYKNCLDCHLTGKYLRGTVTYKDENNVLVWNKFRGSSYSLKEARMMIRPQSDNKVDVSTEEESD